MLKEELKRFDEAVARVKASESAAEVEVVEKELDEIIESNNKSIAQKLPEAINDVLKSFAGNEVDERTEFMFATALSVRLGLPICVDNALPIMVGAKYNSIAVRWYDGGEVPYPVVRGSSLKDENGCFVSRWVPFDETSGMDEETFDAATKLLFGETDEDDDDSCCGDCENCEDCCDDMDDDCISEVNFSDAKNFFFETLDLLRCNELSDETSAQLLAVATKVVVEALVTEYGERAAQEEMCED